MTLVFEIEERDGRPVVLWSIPSVPGRKNSTLEFGVGRIIRKKAEEVAKLYRGRCYEALPKEATVQGS